MKRVIKASGEKERFSTKKIYRSVRDAGGSRGLAKEAVDEVKKKFRGEMKTSEILEIVFRVLKKEKGVYERYGLKQAVMSLGPTGFPFEDFFSKVLEAHGYKVTRDNHLKGKKVIHEVDIVAEKNKKYLVECKYHNQVGTITKLHPALYTYARFLDLKHYNFDFPWLATNTKCSNDAINYAKGVNMKITSWNYPKKESLMYLIESKKIYPITLLRSLNDETKVKLYEKRIVTLKDLIDLENKSKSGLDEKEVLRLINEAKVVMN